MIKDNLGEMFIPVLVYGLVISTFGTLVLLNYRNKKYTENLWLLVGAFTFIVSDSMIAINNFYSSSHLLEVLIIVFYIVVQYLICKAMIIKGAVPFNEK